MTKRSYGDGGIDQRGPDSFRIRYRVNGKRHAATVHGSLSDARKELRRLLRSGDTGEHVTPEKMTLGQWITHWVTIGCPGNKRRREVGQRSIERYHELLRCHVVPSLGNRPLQQLQATEIDDLYVKLGERMSARTAHHVHVVLGACIGAATRTRRLARNPMIELSKVPSPGEADHGMALDAEQLRALVRGFKGSALFSIVAVAAFTGARRNEILALRWSDIDSTKKALRIERALEETEEHGLRVKSPKTTRGTRTITIDDDLLALLLSHREKHLRIVAGVPDDAQVDLSLVKLPEDALMFPNPPQAGTSFSFTRPRNPRAVTKEFVRKATGLGFTGLRFHDLRGSHETMLLDNGVPVHVVAARCGHDPAVLLRSYAKRTTKADSAAANVIAAFTQQALRSD
jgi:integrase